MAPKKTVKTPVYHPSNRKGGKKLGKEVELQKKLQVDAACKIPGKPGKMVTPKDPKFAHFKDPVKESLGVEKVTQSCEIGPNSSSEIGPDGLPFSPREDPNNKGVQAPGPKCPSQNEASICAQKRRERMKRLAIISLGGFLFFLFFWWLFNKSIYRFLGYRDEGDDRNKANGYGGSGDGQDKYNGAGGAGNGGKYRKKGQMCWFNLPCTYDSEDGYKGVGKKSGKSPKLLS